MIISSREFNQNFSQARKAAESEPVIITNRGEPALVLMSYAEYQSQKQQPQKSIAEMLGAADPAVADIELEIPPRSKAQRRPVEF